MLDLSTAFDVTDHQILFQMLEHTFGVTAQSLSFKKKNQKYLPDTIKIVLAILGLICPEKMQK